MKTGEKLNISIACDDSGRTGRSASRPRRMVLWAASGRPEAGRR
jgi:hypothetical protein